MRLAENAARPMKSPIAAAQSLAAQLEQMQPLLEGLRSFVRLAIGLTPLKTSTSLRPVAIAAGADRLRRAGALPSGSLGSPHAHFLTPSRPRISSHPSKPFAHSGMARSLRSAEYVSGIVTQRAWKSVTGDRLIASLRAPRPLTSASYGPSPLSASPQTSHRLQTWLLSFSVARNVYSYASAAADSLLKPHSCHHTVSIPMSLEFGRRSIISSAAVPERLQGHFSQPPVFAASLARLRQLSFRRVASFTRIAGQIRRPTDADSSLNPGISRALFRAQGLQDVTRMFRASRVGPLRRAFSSSEAIRKASTNSIRTESSPRSNRYGHVSLRPLPQNSAPFDKPRKHAAGQSNALLGGAQPINISYAPEIIIHSAGGSDDARLKRSVMDILERHGRELYQVLARETLRRERVEFAHSHSAELRFSEAG